jgi:hypothetical protein
MDLPYEDYINYLNDLAILELLDFDYYEGKRSTVDALTIL